MVTVENKFCTKICGTAKKTVKRRLLNEFENEHLTTFSESDNTINRFNRKECSQSGRLFGVAFILTMCKYFCIYVYRPFISISNGTKVF